MPRYKVKSPGFYNGKLYDPEGKRPVLETDKPFTRKNPMPKWLGDMPKESAELKAKREAYEKAAADLNAEKAQQDSKDINAASTEGDGEKPSFIDKVVTAVSGKSDNVETL